MRKEKSLYRWYCSFSLSPSRSVEFVFQTRQLLFSLFPRLCWTLIFRARLRIMHIAFIHRILPCEDWLFFRHQCFMKQPKQTCSLIINTLSQKKELRKIFMFCSSRGPGLFPLVGRRFDVQGWGWDSATPTRENRQEHAQGCQRYHHTHWEVPVGRQGV